MRIITRILVLTTIIILFITLGIFFKGMDIKELFAEDNRFITMQGNAATGSTTIIIDTETNVMYLWHEDHYKGGLTVMLDKDGKPLLYDK